MTAWLAELRGAADAEFGAVYERLLLHALGVEEPPWARWSSAYARLSEGLTRDRARFLADGTSAAASSEDMRVVAALVHGQRTARLARRLFEAYPLRPGGFVDMGAGSGAGALIATTYGASSVTLVDTGPEALALAIRVMTVAGVEHTAVGADFRRVTVSAPNVLFAFSLNELGTAGGDLVRSLAAAGHAVYVLEPGTRAAARALQHTRDAVVAIGAVVAGPCTHRRPTCPLLESDSQWCHASMEAQLGPIARRILRDSGRDHHVVTASWLVAHPNAGPQAGWRVVGRPVGGKGRAVAVLCGAAGVESVTALTRGPAGQALDRLERGAVVDLEARGLEVRGDGLRLVDARALRVLRPF